MKSKTDTRQIFCRITISFIIWIAQVLMELCLWTKDDRLRIESKYEVYINSINFFIGNLLKFFFNLLRVLSEEHELSYVSFHFLGNLIFLACLFILIYHGPFLSCLIEVRFATVIAQPWSKRRAFKLLFMGCQVLKRVERIQLFNLFDGMTNHVWDGKIRCP